MGEVRREVREFFEFGRKKVQKAGKSEHNIVFIFDQLEQLRDQVGTDGRARSG